MELGFLAAIMQGIALLLFGQLMRCDADGIRQTPTVGKNLILSLSVEKGGFFHFRMVKSRHFGRVAELPTGCHYLLPRARIEYEN